MVVDGEPYKTSMRIKVYIYDMSMHRTSCDRNKFINRIPYEILISRDQTREKDLRSDYYRDSTAIMHSMPFRRLKHKTQVFFAPSNDHICTRMEHSMHVASIAGSIASSLGLDSELVWAIGLGHDTGHTPFGHVGERVLQKFWNETKKEGDPEFQHELLSLRTLRHTALGTKGLNLTYAVLDGVVSHCGESFFNSKMMPDFIIKDFDSIKDRTHIVPSTWEGVVVRFSDSIAYLGRDAEDAARMGLIKMEDIPQPVKKHLGCTNGEIINSLVNNLVENSSEEEGIGFSKNINEVVSEFVAFNYKNIYKSEYMNRETAKRERLLTLLFDYIKYLYSNYTKSPEALLKEKVAMADNFKSYLDKRIPVYQTRGEGEKELLFDYISGLTDTFAIDSAIAILGE